jgi:hypothetical protein
MAFEAILAGEETVSIVEAPDPTEKYKESPKKHTNSYRKN